MVEVNFRITAASLAANRVTKYSPIKGIINSAILHFPGGTEQLVEIFINHKSNQILPYPVTGGGVLHRGITLDDTTQSFDIGEAVEQNDPLEVAVLNHDDSNSHTVSIIILIKKIETYTGP